jgi:hypothetical protein
VKSEFRHVTPDDFIRMKQSRNEIATSDKFKNFRAFLVLEGSSAIDAVVSKSIPDQDGDLLTVVTKNAVFEFGVSENGEIFDEIRRYPLISYLQDGRQPKIKREQIRAALSIL